MTLEVPGNFACAEGHPSELAVGLSPGFIRRFSGAEHWLREFFFWGQRPNARAGPSFREFLPN